ncbi:MAG: NAD(P)H-quinone oxidoreductase [Stappiaceae bacterium]
MPNLPESMTAITILQPGGPEMLVPEQRPVPFPEGSEILIKVHAAGINRPDILQRQGHYPPPKGASDLPGLEVSGEIVATGRNADAFKIGDQVLALTPGGGYAQYAIVDESNALSVPTGVSLEEAAAIPETFFTVFSNVFDRGGLQEGETFLVHGGSSGIGTTAIQLAKAFGARVFTTVGSAEKKTFCEELGAELAIDYKTQDFVSVLKEATSGHGIDVTLDMVGGDYVEKNWKVAATDGRIVQIASLNGSSEEVDFRRLMVKRLTHTGSTLRPRSVAFKAAIAENLKRQVWPLIEAGTVKPVMDSRFPFTEAAAAHERMEGSKHIGKIILTMG